MTRIEEIDAEVEKLEAILEEKNKVWDINRSYEAYCKDRDPEISKICEFDRERRMIQPYTLSELPNYGDVMSLEEFVDCCRSGGFIDYDGYGKYVKAHQETDIKIHPSDVKHNSIRKDFDTIIWYNR